MHSLSALAIICALFAGQAVSREPPRSEPSRRKRDVPGLTIDTGARMGACDALLFSPEGNQLLAAGDDKLVHIWPVGSSGLDPAQVKTLRWATYREQRGSIYALALSPDRDHQHLVVAGYGLRTGAVVVLDRTSGDVKRALPLSAIDTYVIWTLAFSPSGDRIAYGDDNGTVRIWSWKDAKTGAVTTLRPASAGKSPGKVRLVAFLEENQVLAVTENGAVTQWNLGAQSAARLLFQFQSTNLHRVALSPDKRFLAAAAQSRRDNVEVRALRGGESRFAPPPGAEDLPQSLAFDSRSQRLAVGFRTVPASAAFYKETGYKVSLYDLSQQALRPFPGPRVSYLPDALAFHPDGNRMAVAGGNNDEVTLWDLRRLERPVGPVIRGPGRAIWDVALSRDGRYLGYRTQRTPDPQHPNQRATSGPWTAVFDLHDRKWAHLDKLKDPIEPLNALEGWSVQFESREGKKNAFTWFVTGPDKKQYPLPLSAATDHFPRCYTFLKAVGGKPVRLAVGHYWGVSIFELGNHPPRRVRLFTGHQGEVMALAPSADHRMLISASRDQTIAAWSLADWPSSPELGARFKIQQGNLIVDELDPGSPAWDSGMSLGDEITGLYVGPERVTGGPDNWLKKLAHPVPGVMIIFEVKGKPKPPDSPLTSVRQRPLWRFFPTADREWVLWRWRDYYYDTSTRGDQYVGWQVSGEVDEKPEFYKAEQFRNRFHDAEKVAEIIRRPQAAPDRRSFPELEPPRVSIQVSSRQVRDADILVTVTAARHSNTPDQRLAKARLWINDYLLPESEGWQPQQATFEMRNVRVPQSALRTGENILTFHCTNAAGGRGEEKVTIRFETAQVRRPRLHGLSVGVNDYSKLRGFRGVANLNCARPDAESIYQAWTEQKTTGQYAQAELKLLVDQKVTPAAILDHLRDLAKVVQPDDWLLVFLAGHGVSEETKPLSRAYIPGSFVYVCPTTDAARLKQTGLTSESLYAALSGLKCHKLLLLDACHSGDVVMHPLRDLRRDGIGAVILAACAPDQQAGEDVTLNHGYFTLAILESLNQRFTTADTNKDGSLDCIELFDYVNRRVQELGPDQNPKWAPDPRTRVVLAKQRKVSKQGALSPPR